MCATRRFPFVKLSTEATAVKWTRNNTCCFCLSRGGNDQTRALWGSQPWKRGSCSRLSPHCLASSPTAFQVKEGILSAGLHKNTSLTLGSTNSVLAYSMSINDSDGRGWCSPAAQPHTSFSTSVQALPCKWQEGVLEKCLSN